METQSRCMITEIKIFLCPGQRCSFHLLPVASTRFNDTFYYVEYIILLIMDST